MESATTHRVIRQVGPAGGRLQAWPQRTNQRDIGWLAGSGRLLADEVNPPVAHQQEVGNARGRRVVCRAEVPTKASRSTKRLPSRSQMYAAPSMITVPGTR